MTTETTAAETVQSYYDSWKNGIASFDEARLRAIIAPDLKFEGPIAGKREGREPFLRGLADFVGALKTYQCVQQLHAGNEAAAIYDCTLGVTGGAIRFAEFFRIQDGRIQELKLLYDPTEFRRLMAPAS
jgi:SnoaL-like protein